MEGETVSEIVIVDHRLAICGSSGMDITKIFATTVMTREDMEIMLAGMEAIIQGILLSTITVKTEEPTVSDNKTLFQIVSIF